MNLEITVHRFEMNEWNLFIHAHKQDTRCNKTSVLLYYLQLIITIIYYQV